MKRQLLVFSTNSLGGIAEHAYLQCQAIAEQGWSVTLLAPPDFLAGKSLPDGVERRSLLREPRGRWATWRRLRFAWVILANHFILAAIAVKIRPTAILISAYAEYLSPLWFWVQWLGSWLGRCPILANLHDPVRDYEVGPGWWHRLSVGLAYVPLRSVVIHQETVTELSIPDNVRVVSAPHGVYQIAEASESPEEIRAAWGATADHHVFLAFGYVRDNKRIDLMLEAMVDHSTTFLTIIGETATDGARNHEFYRKRAKELGVEDRVYSSDEFTPDERIGSIFNAADSVLLAYDQSFRSQSGVLNLAAACHKPILASSGPSPLLESVRDFDLGVFVSPGSSKRLSEGIQQLLEDPPMPKWEAYARSASWSKNAEAVISEIDELNRG
ncbi:MAG: glycosyltransferase involved in cell wall biosynthesis [Verrucomicrobiales bacterium]|jgi:glycosyltransferase involved in cell wall biosynthesis